jgi:hypothetical protein
MIGMAHCIDVSSRLMRRLLGTAACLGLLSTALTARAQVGPPRTMDWPFAIGGGGEWVTDNDRASGVKAFSNGGYHVFGEVLLEQGVLFQVRYQNFTLPGAPVAQVFGTGAPNTAPDVRVNAGLASIGYVFREKWWDAGLVGGFGVYALSPKPLTVNQSSMDVKQTVLGFHAGLLTAFQVATHWDLRVEATAYTLQTSANHKPITVGGSLAYHF